MSVSLLVGLFLLLIIVLALGLQIPDQDAPPWLCPGRQGVAQVESKAIESIEKLLPQTQCRDCGFDGCRPYAEAIVNARADINRCLPGGLSTMDALAKAVGTEIKPLYKNNDRYKKPRIARIEEEHCIGCVKCIAACPVDAIIGAPKQMHSVINTYCTGCERCVAPCPVDCIKMTAI